MPEDGDGLIDAFLREATPVPGSPQSLRKLPVQDYPAGRALLALPPAAKAEAAAEVLERLALTARQGVTKPAEWAHRQILSVLADRLLRGKLPAGEERLVRLAEAAGRFKRYYLRHAPVSSLVRIVAEHAAANGMGAPLIAALAPLEEEMRGTGEYEEQLARLTDLRAGRRIWEELPAPVQLLPGDAWANTLAADLEDLPAEARAAWNDLLTHCSTATASAPARKWLDRAAELVRAVGVESFAGIASRCLLQIGKPGTRSPVRRGYDEPTLIDESQADLLRGLVWSCSTLADDRADDRLLAAVGAAGAACFQKLTYYGPRDVKVGNACLQALSLTVGPSAVAWLARLRLKIKHPSARRQLEKALERVALREGMSPQELEEISVPTFDLDADGRRRETLGDFTAEVRIAATGGSGAVELAWTRADGSPQKSVPAQARAEYAEELADLKRAAKEIPAVLAAQRDRLERLCRSPHDWSLETWRELYLDHPLVGAVARRLIWWFREGDEERAAVWRAGRFVDAAGTTFDPEPASRVRLWHPLDATAGEVASWRRRLAALAITQPFKQAHREIYRLTDAERETGTFSNRFVGQVLKQHQLTALCAQRGWIYKLQGQWDSHNLPFLFLPEQGLRIELWVEPYAEDEVSANAIYLYVVTGRVSFTGEGGPCRLEHVAPRSFSELMRDVDLFVSVCNAGNDPTWVDRERQRDLGSGWGGHVFGELGATAATRREVLAGLLPKLKIAGRCTLGDRFLVVHGGLRTYKIHLGSGNILMEPNDQYLCIVPAGSHRGPHAFLPYEGDGMLDVILSKAFLLADDAKITDHLILRQVRQIGS